MRAEVAGGVGRVGADEVGKPKRHEAAPATRAGAASFFGEKGQSTRRPGS
jgi:hypothetical protein